MGRAARTACSSALGQDSAPCPLRGRQDTPGTQGKDAPGAQAGDGGDGEILALGASGPCGTPSSPARIQCPRLSPATSRSWASPSSSSHPKLDVTLPPAVPQAVPPPPRSPFQAVPPLPAERPAPPHAGASPRGVPGRRRLCWERGERAQACPTAPSVGPTGNDHRGRVLRLWRTGRCTLRHEHTDAHVHVHTHMRQLAHSGTCTLGCVHTRACSPTLKTQGYTLIYRHYTLPHTLRHRATHSYTDKHAPTHTLRHRATHTQTQAPTLKHRATHSYTDTLPHTLRHRVTHS